MIPVPSDVRVWLATGLTDMRRGMNGISPGLAYTWPRTCRARPIGQEDGAPALNPPWSFRRRLRLQVQEAFGPRSACRHLFVFSGSRGDFETACWNHARLKFLVLADLAAKARLKLGVIAPLALEAVKRIDWIFGSSTSSARSMSTGR
jgi:hypothetical protein